MAERMGRFEQFKRILSNGVKVLSEEIEEGEGNVDFDFTLERNVEVSDLSDLWTPGSNNDVIVQTLIKKGWILPDGTTFVRLKMDILRDDVKNKIKFKYYIAESSPQNQSLKNQH